MKGVALACAVVAAFASAIVWALVAGRDRDTIRAVAAGECRFSPASAPISITPGRAASGTPVTVSATIGEPNPAGAIYVFQFTFAPLGSGSLMTSGDVASTESRASYTFRSVPAGRYLPSVGVQVMVDGKPVALCGSQASPLTVTRSDPADRP